MMKTQRNRRLIVFAYIMLFIALFFWTYLSKGSFIFNLSLYLMIVPIGNSYQKRRITDIQLMWRLSDELGLTISELSSISGIGTIDLECTKKEESGMYLPPEKQIKQTIETLKKRQTNS